MSKIYSIGKVTVTKGSNVVTGIGTSWLTNVSALDKFTINGSDFYDVASIESDTQVTLSQPLTQESRANANYTITDSLVSRDELLSAKLLLTKADLEIDLSDEAKYGIPKTVPTHTVTEKSPFVINWYDGIGEFSDITQPITPENIAYHGNIGGVPVATILAQLTNFEVAFNYVIGITEDNKIDVVEKKTLKQGWDAIVNEYAQLQLAAFAFKSQYSFNNYSAAFWNLQKTFITPILKDMTVDTLISELGSLTKQDMRNAMREYYSYREGLRSEIQLESSRRASWQRIIGDGKPENGATVGAPPGTVVGGTLSEEIEASVHSTVLQIDRYASDNVITNVEKRPLKIMLENMIRDYNELMTLSANNAEYSVERSAFENVSGVIATLFYNGKYPVLIDKDHPNALPDQSIFEDMTTSLNIATPGYQAFHNALTNYETARKSLVNKITTYVKNNAEETKNSTSLLTTLGPPSAVPNPLAISIMLRDNATRSIKLGWTYYQGELPAEWLYLYYKQIVPGGNTTITNNDSYVQVSPTSTYFDFDLDMGSAYVVGIAAVRKDSVGIKVGPIQQPAFWSIEAGEYDFNGKIAGLQSSELVTDAAYTKLAAIEFASDSKLTPGEKQMSLKVWTQIKAEYAALHTEASNPKYSELAATELTNYENSYQTLFTYLEGTNGLLAPSSLDVTSDVNPAVFNAHIYDYYSQRTNLQKKISAIILGAAEEAKVLASNALSSAANAVTSMKNAVLDHVLNEVEKSQMKSERDNNIIPEYNSLIGTATTLGITTEKAAYTTAYNNLISMLNTYIDVPGETDITGSETSIVAVTEAYYAARLALEAKFATQNWNMATTIQNANNILTSNFNAQDNFNTSPIVAPTNPLLSSVLRDNGSATITLTWTWTGNEGDIEGFIITGRTAATNDGYVLGTTPALEGAVVVSANTRTHSIDMVSNLYATVGVKAYRSVDKSVAASGRIESSLATAPVHRPSSVSNITGSINNVPASTLTANLSYVYSFTVDNLNDNMLSAGTEKRQLRADWDAMYAERTKLLAQATNLGVSSVAYDNAFKTVSGDLSYFSTWTSGVPASIADANLDIGWQMDSSQRATMRANLITFITERVALLNALITKASTTSTWDGTTGPGKPENNATKNQATSSASNPTGGNNGDTHYNTATGKLWTNVNGTWIESADRTSLNTSADTEKVNGIPSSTLTSNLGYAYSFSVDMLDNNKISGGFEKRALRTDWDAMYAERTSLLTQATNLGVSSTAYDNAFKAVSTDLNYFATWTSGIPEAIQDINLDGSWAVNPTLRSQMTTNMLTFLTERTALINALINKASTTSTWPGTTGPGKPEDYATKNQATSSASNPTGGNNGDTHYNTATGKLWTNVNGTWVEGADKTSMNTAADTAKVNGVLASSVTSAMINFNNSNDRKSTAIAAPTNVTLSHVVKSVGTVDLIVTWDWAGNEGDIDGFGIYAKTQNTNTPYTLGQPSDLIFPVLASTRKFTGLSVAGDQWYTVGVIAYRSVDPDIAANGFIYSTITQAANYQPTPVPNIIAKINNVDATTLTQQAGAGGAAALIVTDMNADTKLTPIEKYAVRKEWDVASAEKAGINAQATALGITTENNTYNTAFQAVANYLNNGVTWTTGVPTWIADANLSTTTDIVGATYRSTVKAYYDARTALFNKFAEIAATKAIYANVIGTPTSLANINSTEATKLSGVATGATKNILTSGAFSSRPAGSDGDFYYATDNSTLYQKILGAWVVSATVGAPAGTYVGSTLAQTVESNASTALANAAAAQSSADTANAVVADISSDNKFTPTEKSGVRGEWDKIAAEKAGLNAQATSFGATAENTTYNAKFQALADYLNAGVAWTTGVPTWITDANLSVTTDIVGSTFRTKVKEYYDARTALLQKIADIAATKAVYSNVIGTPTSLAAISATEATKLSGIATGATANILSTGLLSARPAGANGDFYYATDTYALYQKIAGAWVTSATYGAPAGTNVGSTPAATVEADSANGGTAYTQTANYRQDIAPTNSPIPSAISTINNSDGTKDITLTWTYTQGVLPADGFIIYYRADTGTVLSTDPGITVSSQSRSYTFSGISQASTYRAGIAAYRKTETGVRTTAIAQPVSAPDWRTIGATPNITGNINSVNSATLTAQATAGNTAASDTTTFRTAGAPNGTLTIGTVTSSASSSAGLINLTLNWSYTNGSLPAEEFVIYAVEGTTAPTTSSPVIAVVTGTARSVLIAGVPMDKNYCAGIVARRTSKSGVETSAIVTGWVRTGVTATVAATSAPASGITGQLATAQLADSAVSSVKIAASAVTAAKTAIAAIDPATGNLTANSVTANNIAAGTITGDKIQAGSITSVGTITAGNFDTPGYGRFTGGVSVIGYNCALVANPGATQAFGVYGNGSVNGVYGESSTSIGVQGYSTNGIGVKAFGGTQGVYGYALSSAAIGVKALNSFGGVALDVVGKMQISSTTVVANLNADRLDDHHASDFLLTSGTAANSNSLGGYAASSWCRGVLTQSGTAYASGTGFSMYSSVSGIWVTCPSSNQISIISTSDERLKFDINDEVLGLGFINSLKPVSYRYKVSPHIKMHGFIAQDVELLIDSVDDSLRQVHEDGIKGVDYISLIAPLVKAIQELSIEVSNLKSQLNSQQGA